jgi:mono/diheme cytochrome c family protein
MRKEPGGIRALLCASVPLWHFPVVVLLGLLLAGCGGRTEPAAEQQPDQRAKLLTIPDEYKNKTNPLPASYGNLTEGRTRFEQYCALCHGVDGKGATLLGRTLYPPASDLTAPQMRRYSDGQLYWIAAEGIRFSGMPASRPYSTEEQIWRVVLHIRQFSQSE